MLAACPLRSESGQANACLDMSALCQKLTFAVQQTILYSITLSAPAIRRTAVMEYRSELPDHSGLMPANLITLAHFSVSSAMNFPNSAEVINVGLKPMSRRRTFT